jgi:hypothetical protein
MLRRPLEILAIVALTAFIGGQAVAACPFCTAVSQTFTEEISAMDVVVVAELLPDERPRTAADEEESPTARFKVTKVIKGAAYLGKQQVVETSYFGQAKPGSQFLVMAVDPPKLSWSTPLRISDRGVQYVTKILSLPADGVERLRFFQNYLEDSDEMLARDAYDEFAKAPYATVIGLKPDMKHGQLVSWIKDADIPASRRRLYLTMLGVCGQPDDIPMLEEMLKSDDRKWKAGLDAMVACYLTLKGSDGMPLVEELFLKNKDAEYADTYAAIMALRFHGTEVEIVPKKRLLQGLHHMLDRPQLADLVIPDLARWEDWSQMDRLVTLFKEADDKSSWVRVPVVNYLRACPLPEAKQRMAELEKIDPASVKRANVFFPFPASSASSGS